MRKLTYFIFFCSALACNKEQTFCYESRDFENNLLNKCEMLFSLRIVNDSVKYLRWGSNSKYFYENQDAIYESDNNIDFFKSYSLADSISSHTSKSFYGETLTKLHEIKSFIVNDIVYRIYKFHEEGKSGEAFFSYYTPRLGFFLYNDLHSGSQLTLRNNEASSLLDNVKKDKEFCGEMHLKNPEVKLEEYLPEKDSVH